MIAQYIKLPIYTIGMISSKISFFIFVLQGG